MLIVTGAGGLIGSQAVKYFTDAGFDVVGIDNNMRSYFFGKDGDVSTTISSLQSIKRYTHFDTDIRDFDLLQSIFKRYTGNITAIIHCAAQPSHDWACKEPITDFTVNAIGTLNLLELCRQYSPDAAFIFTSTNKVYGDKPNYLPLIELDTRWSIDPTHHYSLNGIDESIGLDNTLHSIFGVSKASADLMVQEYGRYFGMKTVCFRGGCLTGPNHQGAELHGFLSYLVKACVREKNYTVFGYKGKQVRDNIHSYDLVCAFDHFINNPRSGEVYNIGGGTYANISMIEAINKIQDLSGKEMKYEISETPRIGDHIWYVSDISKFMNHFPGWKITKSIDDILEEMVGKECET